VTNKQKQLLLEGLKTYYIQSTGKQSRIRQYSLMIFLVFLLVGGWSSSRCERVVDIGLSILLPAFFTTADVFLTYEWKRLPAIAAWIGMGSGFLVGYWVFR